MKVSVCACVYYHYEVEVADWMVEKDEENDLAHEDMLVNICYEGDPTSLDGVDEYDGSIVSICDPNGNELYVG